MSDTRITITISGPDAGDVLFQLRKLAEQAKEAETASRAAVQKAS